MTNNELFRQLGDIAHGLYSTNRLRANQLAELMQHVGVLINRVENRDAEWPRDPVHGPRPDDVLTEEDLQLAYYTATQDPDPSGVDLDYARVVMRATQAKLADLHPKTTHAVLAELVRLKRLKTQIERDELAHDLGVLQAAVLDYTRSKPVAWGDAFKLIGETK